MVCAFVISVWAAVLLPAGESNSLVLMVCAFVVTVSAAVLLPAVGPSSPFLAVGAFAAAVWAALLLPPGESNSLLALGAAVMVALAVVAAHSTRVRLLPVVARTGPPVSAQRRRRGSFLRQSNPDTAGRVRPRAPGYGG